MTKQAQMQVPKQRLIYSCNTIILFREKKQKQIQKQKQKQKSSFFFLKEKQKSS